VWTDAAPGPRRVTNLGRGRWASAAIAVTIAAMALSAEPAHAIRVATYNLLQYPALSLSARQPYFRTVMNALDPDVLFCQEIDSAAGKDSMLNNVLNVVRPGEYVGDWRDVGSGEGMAVFWKPAKVSITNIVVLAINSGPRDVMWGLVRPNGYGTSSGFRVYSMHFKAGNGDLTPMDSTTRRLECGELRNLMNFIPASVPWLLVGDSNFYGDWEGGYIRLTESQADNDGRCNDPLTMPGTWHDNSLYKNYVTQCPCASGCPAGFSGGGLDDRFDLILRSSTMADGARIDMVPGSVTAYGNDGLHFNNDIDGDFFNNAVPLAVASALRQSSDHIPVYADIQVPARIAADSQLDFGKVVVGATTTLDLTVANGAPLPADGLDYSLSAPTGFTAPGGSFSVDAGVAGNVHAIGIDASTTGAKSGTLTVASNDPDSASKAVLLSGSVVRHASPSLDSTAVMLTGTADLGDHAIRHFSDLGVRLYNQGYDASQALLSLDGAVVTGGGGRFTVVNGPPALIGTGATLSIRFDSDGATLDSTYDASLTLQTSDEPRPGATSLPSVTVTLRARPISGVLGTDPSRITKLAFYPARPNPVRGETMFAYDLPDPASVSLEVFDLGGRRVATLASGEQSAGRHQVAWKAHDESGSRVPGGLYFARFSTRDLTRFERVIVLP
jgi:hypothetical protein